MSRTAYRKEIEVAAVTHRLSPDLVESMVLVESSGRTSAYRYEPTFWITYLKDNPEYAGRNPERVSASYGLLQIMYPVAREIGYNLADPEHLFVPAIGLEYGCRYLRRLLDWSHDNVDQALAAFNGGKRGNLAPPYRNQGYVDKVRSA